MWAARSLHPNSHTTRRAPEPAKNPNNCLTRNQGTIREASPVEVTEGGLKKFRMNKNDTMWPGNRLRCGDMKFIV
jgi:hypothetical protein